MTATTLLPSNVEKEQMNNLVFPVSEVLSSPEKISKRKLFIDTGMKLGNNFKRKVKIVFEDHEGIKLVETTIWAATENNVSLKGGRIIPINRIHGVYLF